MTTGKTGWLPKRWRAGRAALAVLLAVAVVFTGGFGAGAGLQAPHASAAAGETFFDFENFALGPLNGQNGWTNAGPEVTVTDQVYAVSGVKSVKIVDNDKTKAVGARTAFAPIQKGSVEWWAKADTADRLVMLLESTGPQGSKPVEWIGFLANRSFEYYDGATRVTSSEQYETGKWYRFRVDFDAAAGKKTIMIFDGDDLLLLRKDTAFRDASAGTVNLFRFATISTGVGTFYMDDVRIRDSRLADPGELQRMAFHPDSMNVVVGQTLPVALLGHYTNGDVKAMNDSLVSYASAQPEVATAGGGTVSGISPGSTVVTATYGSVQATLDVNVYSPNDIPPYYNLHLRPLHGDTDVQGLQIVAPEEAQWQALGQRIASGLQSRWNVPVTVVAPTRDKFRSGWSGNTIVLGTLGNNEQLARLYGLRMSYADAIYPGDGGYQLQTIIDPFGLGGNTIVVGASDLAGAELGVTRLLQIAGSQSAPSLPWLHEAKLSDQASSYLQYDGKPTPENIQTALRSVDTWLSRLKPNASSETDAASLHYVLSRIKIFGENFLLTGDPGFAEVYKKLLLGYANYVNRYPSEAKTQLNERQNMWTDGDAVIQNWAVLEASPVFASAQRKQIASAMKLTYEANARDGYLTGAPATGPRWNHQIFPALSLIAGSDYFAKYYKLPEAAGWRQLGERIFTGNTSYISLDEGSDYLMHVPMTNIDYGMATGNLDFIAKSLRPSADLNALMIDNLGTMSGGGDTYPFGYSNAYSWGHSQVMNAATLFYGDPLYRFLLQRTRTGPFPGQRMSDLSYPIHMYTSVKLDETTELNEDDYPKLQAYPVEQGIYDDLKEKEQKTELDVALPDTFHKMTFREGFGADDSYLIVDGFSAGAHGHQDGNAILNYSANGRLFLTDRDYIENTPEHHSGLVVVKDGEQPKKPPLAKLEWSADIGGTALSRSTVPNYNGTDWERSIVSPDGSFYIVYDNVRVNEAGSYMLKNNWQTLGTPTVRGGKFEAEQQGVTMTIESLDDSDLRTQDRYGHFQKYWKSEYPYPYADKETVLSEVLEERGYAAGERAEFVNVLSSRKEDGPQLNARRLNDTTVEIKRQGQAWYAVQGALETDEVGSDGKFHLLGEGRLLAADATRVRIGSQTLQFAEPVMFMMDTTNGRWETYSLRKDRVRYDASGEPIREGALETGTAAWTRQMEHRLVKAVKEKEHPREWAKPGGGDHEGGGQPRDWERVYRFSEQVTDTAWGDLDGDGKEEIVFGGIGGKVEAIGETGDVRWTFAAAGRVNEVTVQTLNGQPVVFVATENWYVHALNAQGQELWNYKFPSDAAHRERKGNLLGITNVRVAYVNGADQPPWVMVGTQFRYIYGLDAAGKLQYEDLLYYYGIEDMEFADFDGDGKEEGMYALEYAYYTYWNEKQLTRGGTGGGPGWKVATLLNDPAFGAAPAIAFGTKQSEVRLVGYAGKLQERWKRNVGGEVNDIRYGDYNGDGVPEILAGSDGFQFYALNPDGTTRFRAALPDRVLQVDGARRDGVTRYYAAADHGLLVQLNEQGAVEATTRFAHPIAALKAGETQPRPWAVLENGELYRGR
ncbi:hypothetical protein [Paenibacillus sp. GYB003]|uniref:hypothetical protein n=1 Tax=Paenibacillus sp. GYB003 TaxID=2994392 RepID=UPI002F963E02